MKIAIDIGNTTIAIGLSTNGETIDRLYRINTDKQKSSDEYALILKDYIHQCDDAVVSSVVPELNDSFRAYFTQNFNVRPIFVGRGVKTGIKINSDNPKEVGADLISNAVGATEHYSETCLIIDLGTGTTFTYIDKKTLKGVAIAAGLTTSKDALFSKTSLLPQVELLPPKRTLGKNSVDAIQSGLVYGHASMIDGMIKRIKTEIRQPDLTVVMTGGHARFIHESCQEEIIRDDILILRGLLTILKKNKA
ncbi:MAG TPA: type III pantothenate kinase [Candidatus Izemoplasmatales bacterium]|nr:type III pantothenate kinase [Candidatus Izemoplasmatales bacterium]